YPANFAGVNAGLTTFGPASPRKTNPQGSDMRVEGPNRVGQGAYPARRVAGGSGFSLPEAESQAPAHKPAGMVHAPALDALLALQSVDGPAERRKKAMSRGRRLLDLLDSIKLGLLDGGLTSASLASLSAAL